MKIYFIINSMLLKLYNIFTTFLYNLGRTSNRLTSQKMKITFSYGRKEYNGSTVHGSHKSCFLHMASLVFARVRLVATVGFYAVVRACLFQFLLWFLPVRSNELKQKNVGPSF
jgi:hypothetical protein